MIIHEYKCEGLHRVSMIEMLNYAKKKTPTNEVFQGGRILTTFSDGSGVLVDSVTYTEPSFYLVYLVLKKEK
jgi:hypothetical protein